MRTGKDPSIISSFPIAITLLLRWIGLFMYWVTWPVIHRILAGSKRTRIVLLSERGECLLVRPYLGSGRWKLPGGGVGRTENALAAAERELFEEVGIRSVESFTAITTVTLTENAHQYEAHILGTHIKRPATLLLRQWEIAEAGWFPLETALATLDNPDAATMVRLWADR